MDETLARDAVAMWQSELTAMAADRELRESWTAVVALWAQSARHALTLASRDPPGSPSPAEPPRTASIIAASQPGLDEIARLTRRVDELEQILARFIERESAGPANPEDGV